MSFGSQQVGTSSPPQTATLTNASPASVTISGITINGADPQDYSQQNNCPATLAINGSCQVQVTFTPTMTGDRSASLSVSYEGHGSPQTVPLDGEGLAAATVSLKPSSLAFPVQLIHTASKPQTATLTNTGTVDVLISSISTATPFSQTNNCPSDLPVGKSCQIKVTFTPQERGPVNGTLSVTDNAQGSPQTVSLSGSGMIVKLSPIGINFGNQKVGTTSNPVPVTLTNEGTETLNISQITIMGSNAGDFGQTNNCGSSVPAGDQCTIQVTFTPTQTGERSATLAVYDDGGGSPQKVALSGTGT
jgi:two-component sensor histidine kinase